MAAHSVDSWAACSVVHSAVWLVVPWESTMVVPWAVKKVDQTADCLVDCLAVYLVAQSAETTVVLRADSKAVSLAALLDIPKVGP